MRIGRGGRTATPRWPIILALYRQQGWGRPCMDGRVCSAAEKKRNRGSQKKASYIAGQRMHAQPRPAASAAMLRTSRLCMVTATGDQWPMAAQHAVPHTAGFKARSLTGEGGG